MESNNNLASLRDMSESQIDALLRFDSPPETPSQMTHMISTEQSINNKIQSEPLNNILLNNREQLNSQMNSQIDFPIFNHDKENLPLDFTLPSFKLQNRENDDSVLMFSQNTGYITLSSCEQSNTIFCNDEENTEYIRCNSIPCDNMSKSHNFESDKELKNRIKYNDLGLKSKNEDMDEIDDILENIDFESISKLSGNRLNNNVSILSQRDCLSENAIKNCALKSNEKMVASCPAHITDANLLKSNTTSITPNIPSEKKTMYDVRDLELNEQNSTNMDVCSLNDDMTVDFASVLSGEYIFNNEGSQHTNITNDEVLYFLQNKDKNDKVAKSLLSKNLKIEENHGSLIPLSVKQLYDIVKADNSDFAFIYALSAQLCQDRVPMECFVILKMALLLSLVSIGNDPDRPPLPVVAMANDTYMTEYLMLNIGKLATRFVGPIVDIKSHTFSNNWIEADPMVLSRGGVYYAGDWNRLKNKRAESIFKNIECSTIPVEKSNLNYPLESAIWTHWRSYKYNSKDQQTFNNFIKIFGIPVFVSDDSHETLVEYTLEQSSIRIFESTIDHLSINEDDMRKFIVYVSQFKVNLTPEAEALLKNYFVASRSFRQDCLTKQSYISLKQFAESFCKLAMRSEVSTDDALAAIIMCEHAIENIFSSRCDPSPHFGTFPFVGAVDEYLIDFKKWLESFLNKFSKN